MKRVRNGTTCAVVLALAASLTACTRRARPGERFDGMLNACPGVSLTVVEGTAAPGGAEVELKNETEGSVGYGNAYGLLISRKDSYHTAEVLNDRIGFTEEEYILEPGQNVRLELDWGALYGALPAGKCCVVMGVNLYPDSGENSVSGVLLAGEFTLE